jgi:hypothetical protein
MPSGPVSGGVAACLVVATIDDVGAGLATGAERGAVEPMQAPQVRQIARAIMHATALMPDTLRACRIRVTMDSHDWLALSRSRPQGKGVGGKGRPLLS